MSSRTTRNKLRHQSKECAEDLDQALMGLNDILTTNKEFVALRLKKAQKHLTYIAALAEDRSDYINENLPIIITYLNMVIKTLDQFNDGL